MKEIPLGFKRFIRPENKGMVTLVDDEDYEKLSKHRWSASYQGKGKHRKVVSVHTNIWDKRRRKWRTVNLQNLIVTAPDGKTPDHIDRNPLNNQKYNLRPATSKQNAANRSKQRTNGNGPCTSQYKGVSWNIDCRRWIVRIAGIYLGIFYDEKEAARAYNKKALELYGEFAHLNPV